jgi:hypothetical protein
MPFQGVNPGAGLAVLVQRVLKTANSVLDFALNPLGLADRPQLGVAYRLADGLFDRAWACLAARAIRSLSMTTTPTVDMSSAH